MGGNSSRNLPANAEFRGLWREVFFAGNRVRVGVEGTGSGPDFFLLAGRVRISW